MARPALLVLLMISMWFGGCADGNPVDPATVERERFPAAAAYFTIDAWRPSATIARSVARYDNWELVHEGTLCSAPLRELMVLMQGDQVSVVNVGRSPFTIGLAPADGMIVLPTSAVLAPDGSRVAWLTRSAASDGPAELYVRDVPGGAPRLLASDALATDIPSFSNDGKSIAYYLATGGLAVVGLDGGRVVVSEAGVAYGGRRSAPVWSPDGKSVAYITGAGGGTISVVDPAGTSPRVVLRSSSEIGTIHSLTWSPDSRHIAFDYESLERSRKNGMLAWVSVETGGVEMLSPGNHLTPGTLRPQWSRDGNAILYVSRPQGPVGYAGISWIDVPSGIVGNLSPGFYDAAYWLMMP
jgi:Tol biopolymer transport system component